MALGKVFTVPKPNPSQADESASAVPLNSTLMIFHEADFKRVREQMAKVIALGNRTINLVPTLGFEVDENRHVKNYCLLIGSGRCRPLTKELIASYTETFKGYMTLAIEYGLNVSFVPHLDSAGDSAGFWRNSAFFDPLHVYDGFTYNEIMLQPLAAALPELLKSGKHVHFALQGEMGATVFYAANSYRAIARQLREQLTPHLRSAGQLDIGISMNFNKVGGKDGNDNLYYYGSEELQAVQALVNEVDFVGISGYGPVSIVPVAQDFNSSIHIFMRELNDYGVYVPHEKELHFSEVSLGGGSADNDGARPASSVAEAAAMPYSGLYGAYSIDKDPWQNPELRTLRVNYHRALLEYLSTSGLTQWKVTAAYLWNTNSWDVQGLYNSQSEPYRDEEIMRLIRSYNLKAARPRKY